MKISVNISMTIKLLLLNALTAAMGTVIASILAFPLIVLHGSLDNAPSYNIYFLYVLVAAYAVFSLLLVLLSIDIFKACYQLGSFSAFFQREDINSAEQKLKQLIAVPLFTWGFIIATYMMSRTIWFGCTVNQVAL